MKFPKVSGKDGKLFADALDLYRGGKYSECYGIISSLAEAGVARGVYCKAILDINANVPEALGGDAFFSGIKRAMSMKYPLAFGTLAMFYYENSQYAELVELCISNKKLAEPRLMTLLASVYDGFYADALDKANDKLAAKTFAAAGELFDRYIKYPTNTLVEWEENDLYLGLSASLKQTYAFLNRLLMISYKYSDVYANRKAYREAYKMATAYSKDDLFLFAVHRINAETCMDDVMGLSDLKTVNSSMKNMEDAYQRLDEELREANSESYDAVWEKYGEYYKAESERLASINLHATSDMESLFPGMGVSDVISGLSAGVARWANTPSSTTEYSYEIDGVKYKKGDNLGYLYDENGNRTGYRIDDVDRLRTEDGEELGYFSTDGIFMPKK